MLSIKTGLIIKNRTQYEVKLMVSEVNNNDWDGDSRPDRNVHGKILAPNDYLRVREELNKSVESNKFRLFFKLNNGDSFNTIINQRWAYEGIEKTMDDAITHRYNIRVRKTSYAEYDYLLVITISDFHTNLWMTESIDFLKDKCLMDICLLGSHDSGMGEINDKTTWAWEHNTRNHCKTIDEQLYYGARYFDVRPAIGKHKGETTYVTGHYGDTGFPLRWQGANGQCMKDIVNQINAFTKNRKELIILYLSHSLDTLNGFKNFDQKKWHGLFDMLENIEAKVDFRKLDKDLRYIPLNKLISNQSAVIMVCGDYNKIDEKYYFIAPNTSLTMYDKYSNTNDITHLIKDQKRKMEDNKIDTTLFSLAWALTQNWIQASNPGESSILDLAKEANRELLYIYSHLKITKKCFPNIINIDDIDRSDYAELVMEINRHRMDG